MDSNKEYLDSEITTAGNSLLSLLQNSLCPDYVRDKENILLTAPWEEKDYRVGIYLYDIQDYSALIPQMSQTTMINDTESRFPPKAVELSYLIFCNDNQRFGGIRREQTHETLNEIIRVIYDNPIMQEENQEAIGLSFLRETVSYKISLWQSFSQPLRPAVYIKAVPVLIASERLRRIHRVKERKYDVSRTKEE